VYVWNCESGSILEELSGHGEGSVNSVAWHPRNERMFASCSDDHTVRIWESPPAVLTTSNMGRGRVGGRMMLLGGEGAMGVGSRNGYLSHGNGNGVSNGKGKGVVRQSWDGHGAMGVGSGSAS